MDRITENLYLGNIKAASNIFLLKKLVSIILNHLLGYYSYIVSGSRHPTNVSRGNIIKKPLLILGI
jgi:hypothetical protein